MAANHSNIVTVNVNLSALPPARQGFSVPLYIVAATGNLLGGATTKRYGSSEDVAVSLAASEITATTADALTTAFGQQPRLSSILVVNATGDAAYDVAYTKARADDDDFYGVAMDNDTDAEVELVSAIVETDAKKFFVAQSSTATWLTAGVPPGLTGLTGRERTAVLFHDTSSEPAGLAWLASRLVYDPDLQSAAWDGRLREIVTYATGLTDAERDLAKANFANVMLPLSAGGVQYVLDGVNVSGRPVYEILSGDWFAARILEDTLQRKLELADRGQKWMVDASGQNLWQGILEGRALQGEGVGHFTPGQTRVTMPAITGDDETNRRIRGDVEAQVGISAVRFVTNLYQTTSPLAAV